MFGIRFCIFFYTALKIHISQCTADILIQAGSFELEERGEVEMKVISESTVKCTVYVFFICF